jgi:hypothetical protein
MAAKGIGENKAGKSFCRFGASMVAAAEAAKRLFRFLSQRAFLSP